LIAMVMTSTTHSTPATAPAARARRFQALPGDHRFYSAMAVVMTVTILAGFSNTYLPRLAAGQPVLAIIHLHALVFTSWLALFVVQTTLVRTGRIAVHRRLGVAGVALAALMLVLGVATGLAVTRQGSRGIPGVEFPDPEGFLLLNLAAAAVFAVLVGAGWHFRRDLQTHKRLMLMATAGTLIGPGVSRLPFASGRPAVIGILAMAFLLAGPVYDLVTRRRVHPAYLWSGLLAFAATPPVVAQLGATAAWHSIAFVFLR
jgi:FtsH-binding integral membrane protein